MNAYMCRYLRAPWNELVCLHEKWGWYVTLCVWKDDSLKGSAILTPQVIISKLDEKMSTSSTKARWGCASVLDLQCRYQAIASPIWTVADVRKGIQAGIWSTSKIKILQGYSLSCDQEETKGSKNKIVMCLNLKIWISRTYSCERKPVIFKNNSMINSYGRNAVIMVKKHYSMMNDYGRKAVIMIKNRFSW